MKSSRALSLFALLLVSLIIYRNWRSEEGAVARMLDSTAQSSTPLTVDDNTDVPDAPRSDPRLDDSVTKMIDDAAAAGLMIDDLQIFYSTEGGEAVDLSPEEQEALLELFGQMFSTESVDEGESGIPEIRFNLFGGLLEGGETTNWLHFQSFLPNGPLSMTAEFVGLEGWETPYLVGLQGYGFYERSSKNHFLVIVEAFGEMTLDEVESALIQNLPGVREGEAVVRQGEREFPGFDIQARAYVRTGADRE